MESDSTRAGSRKPRPTTREVLECGLCKKTLEKPRMLSRCGHTFCSLCLRRHIEQKKIDDCYPCPEPSCTRQYSSESKADDSNWYMSFLLGEDAQRNVSYFPQKCESHNQLISYYCPKCDEAICAQCLAEDHSYNHDRRNILDIEEGVARKKERLQELTREAEIHRTQQVDAVISELQLTEKSMQHDCDKAKSYVEDTVRSLNNALTDFEKEVVSMIEKHKNLGMKKISSLLKVYDLGRNGLKHVEQQSEELRCHQSGCVEMFTVSRTLEKILQQQKSIPIDTVEWTGNFNYIRQALPLRDLIGSLALSQQEIEHGADASATDAHSSFKDSFKVNQCANEINGLVVTRRYICVVHAMSPNLWLYDKEGNGGSEKRIVVPFEVAKLKNPKSLVLTDAGQDTKSFTVVVSCAQSRGLCFVTFTDDISQSQSQGLLRQRFVETDFVPGFLSFSTSSSLNLIVAEYGSQNFFVYTKDGTPVRRVTPPAASVREVRCIVEHYDPEEEKKKYAIFDAPKGLIPVPRASKVFWMDDMGKVQDSNARGLKDPRHVIQDNRGRLLVADAGNHKIHILSDQKPLKQEILARDDVKYPTCVFLDEPSGTLYVGHGDGNDRRVSAYNYILYSPSVKQGQGCASSMTTMMGMSLKLCVSSNEVREN